MNNERKSNPTCIGLILIILGVIFLSDSFHIIRIGHLLARWWPLILIIIGLVKLNGRDRSGGVFLLIIGVLFLLSEMHIISWGQIWRFWPVILIIVGFGMLVRHSSLKKDNSADFSSILPEDKFEINAIFNNIERQITSQQFRGGEVNAVFGNLRLDLRQVKIVPDGCTLISNAIFGSLEIFVPAGISVNFQVSQFMGKAANYSSSTVTGPVLTIKGDAVFGNIRISN